MTLTQGFWFADLESCDGFGGRAAGLGQQLVAVVDAESMVGGLDGQGDAVRQVVLLQYGDDPEIEPGDLWVRVLLAADGPDDYERSMREFQHDHEAAMEQFADHMAGKLREICQVEFTPEKPSTATATAPDTTWGSGQGLPTRGRGNSGRGYRWTCTPLWAARAWNPSTR